MKRNIIAFACTGFLLTGMLAGCGGQKAPDLVNTLTFTVGDFETLRLDYDAEDIQILEAGDSKVTVKEYMNEDKKRYYARTSIKNGELFITEGDRPRRSSFQSYIELYLPQDYTGSIALHTTSGTIHSDMALNLSGDLSVDTTSGIVEVSNATAPKIKATSTNGQLRLETINADRINIETTNAATSMNRINGMIHYQSKGGQLTASDLSGSGTFQASGDGSIDISFGDVIGDISAYSKNGTLTVMLPENLSFKFSATTKEGSINTSFADQLAVTDNTAAGTIGASPDATVKLETRNGNIKVSR